MSETLSRGARVAVLACACTGLIFDGIELGLMPVASLSVSRSLLGDAYTPELGGVWFARFTAALMFGAAIGGYAGGPPWVIAASAIALAAISYSEHYHLYRRGQELGLTDVLEGTVLRSAMNAVIAAGGAYGFGMVFALLK